MMHFDNEKDYLLALHYHQINAAAFQYYESKSSPYLALRDFNSKFE